MHIHLTLSTPIAPSAIAREMAERFDLSLGDRVEETLDADLPDLNEPWRIGAIVGPSGSGKSSIVNSAYADALLPPMPWPKERPILDAFGNLSLDRITWTLSAVGFSSPPSWLKPYAVLSQGEKFRADLARALLLERPLIVVDEFASTLDRTVARTACAALAKAMRAGRFTPRLVAVTAHHDILRWLEPDWVYDTGRARQSRRRLRRPRLHLRVRRAGKEMWPGFSPHHYLSGRLHPAAQCYLATVSGQPAVFVAVLPHPHPRRPGWREHRLVCLPQFQGIGLGNATSEFVASLYTASGKPYFSTTAHPAMLAHRMNSPLWRLCRRPRAGRLQGRTTSAANFARTISTTRITAGFEYVGPSRAEEANRLRHRDLKTMLRPLD